MKPTAKPMKPLLMERRKFLSGAAALGVGAGLSAPAIASRAATEETAEIAWRDQDLPFIGAEETYSTDELIAKIAFNDDHANFLKSLGLAELGSSRIAAMDNAGINVQILSVHTPGVQNVPVGKASILRIVSTRRLPMARWPPIRDGSRHLQPCRCRTRRHQRTNWNAPFGKMALWEP